MKIMLRFEEKAYIRQRMLDAVKKTKQMGWMLHERLRKMKNL